jgi:hypothetical protein
MADADVLVSVTSSTVTKRKANSKHDQGRPKKQKLETFHLQLELPSYSAAEIAAEEEKRAAQAESSEAAPSLSSSSSSAPSAPLPAIRATTFELSPPHTLAVKSIWYIDRFMYENFTKLIWQGIEKLNLKFYAALDEMPCAETATAIVFFAHKEETIQSKPFDKKKLAQLIAEGETKLAPPPQKRRKVSWFVSRDDLEAVIRYPTVWLTLTDKLKLHRWVAKEMFNSPGLVNAGTVPTCIYWTFITPRNDSLYNTFLEPWFMDVGAHCNLVALHMLGAESIRGYEQARLECIRLIKRFPVDETNPAVERYLITRKSLEKSTDRTVRPFTALALLLVRAFANELGLDQSRTIGLCELFMSFFSNGMKFPVIADSDFVDHKEMVNFFENITPRFVNTAAEIHVIANDGPTTLQTHGIRTLTEHLWYEYLFMLDAVWNESNAEQFQSRIVSYLDCPVEILEDAVADALLIRGYRFLTLQRVRALREAALADGKKERYAWFSVKGLSMHALVTAKEKCGIVEFLSKNMLSTALYDESPPLPAPRMLFYTTHFAFRLMSLYFRVLAEHEAFKKRAVLREQHIFFGAISLEWNSMLFEYGADPDHLVDLFRFLCWAFGFKLTDMDHPVLNIGRVKEFIKIFKPFVSPPFAGSSVAAHALGLAFASMDRHISVRVNTDTVGRSTSFYRCLVGRAGWVELSTEDIGNYLQFLTSIDPRSFKFPHFRCSFFDEKLDVPAHRLSAEAWKSSWTRAVSAPVVAPSELKREQFEAFAALSHAAACLDARRADLQFPFDTNVVVTTQIPYTTGTSAGLFTYASRLMCGQSDHSNPVFSDDMAVDIRRLSNSIGLGLHRHKSSDVRDMLPSVALVAARLDAVPK